MKGYIDENGCDCPPCDTCIHRFRERGNCICDGCIRYEDMVNHRPRHQSEYVNYNRKVIEAWKDGESE